MEFKKGLLAVLLMAQSFSVSGAEAREKEHPANYDPFSLSLRSFQNQCEYLKNAAEEEAFKKIPNFRILTREQLKERVKSGVTIEDLVQQTYPARDIVTEEEIGMVHGAEKWTIMQFWAYQAAKGLPEAYQLMTYIAGEHQIALNAQTCYTVRQAEVRSRFGGSEASRIKVDITACQIAHTFSKASNPIRTFFDVYKELARIENEKTREIFLLAMITHYKEKNFCGIEGLEFDPRITYWQEKE